MPVITRYLGYNIYIWTDENIPLEPVHVHVAHSPRRNADKFWITKDGLVVPCEENSELKRSEASKIMSYLSDEILQKEIKDKWLSIFGEIDFHK